MNEYSEVLVRFAQAQIGTWPMADENYTALSEVQTKTVQIGELDYKIHFNPRRIRSASANIAPQALLDRPCFLCSGNRPPEQESIPFDSDYLMLINPFPIFNPHFTIAASQHTRQIILPNFAAMLRLAQKFDAFTVFYNGPQSGASAPDHFHFQAIRQGILQVEKQAEHLCRQAKYRREHETASVYFSDDDVRRIVFIQSADSEAIEHCFSTLYNLLNKYCNHRPEPMMNIAVWHSEEQWNVALLLRGAHRPTQYYAIGNAQFLISPGLVEMCGNIVVARDEDYAKITAADIKSILRQVTLPKVQFEAVALDAVSLLS